MRRKFRHSGYCWNVHAFYCHTKKPDSNTFYCAKWEYSFSIHDENGKIDITPKELEILKVLIENKGLVVSRNQILDDVWGYDCDVIDRTIDAYIRNIRKKLRLDCITTVKGIGYKFEMENHYENKAIL